MTASRENQPHRRIRYWPAAGFLLACIAGLNALGFVPGFCDFYAQRIYPVLTEPLSRLCDLTPQPIGEFIMFAGIALVAVALATVLALAFFRKRSGLARIACGYLKAVLLVVLLTLFMFTLNYLLPLRATPLVGSYAAPQDTSEKAGYRYSLEQLEALRAQVVEGLNSAAAAAPRTDDGGLAYTGKADVDATVRAALQDLGEEFPRLAGFYPAPKAALCSDVLEWMGIGGYTYPYTMEVTYNRYVSQLYYPVLTAHESVHHKGFYLESEAEFLSYLACAKSSDAIVRYSGYDNIYYYVENAYAKALVSEFGEGEARARYQTQVQVSDQVAEDRERVASERAQAYEAGVNKQAEEALSGAANSAAEYGWSAQGQILQGNSYSGVVELLLAYTYGA